jgi:cbb3-type cytochrome oxidase maturation protein
MPLGLWVVVGWMAFVILSGFAFMAWGLRTGQFDDVEAPKYRMLEDTEPLPWPDGSARKGAGSDA